jgi:prepilin-type N-terminal cleavage/methylation domain-containing protein
VQLGRELQLSGNSFMKARFTLLELLIVIAIIGILLTILLPSLINAKSHAKFAVCKSNQKQIGVAFVAYASSNNQYLPNGTLNGGMAKQSSWEIRLGAYLGVDYSASFLASNGEVAPIDNPVLLCPGDESDLPSTGFARSYQVNGYGLWYNKNSEYGAFGSPQSRILPQIKSNTVILVESHFETDHMHQGCSWFSAMANEDNFDQMYSYHLKSKYNFLYEDGRVATHKKNDLMLNNKELLMAIE